MIFALTLSQKKNPTTNNNVMKISYIMKAYIKVLIITLVASVCIGCKSKIDVAVDEQLSEIDSNVEIDANDVAWATGWTIYKWKLGALTSEPVHAIHLVVIGSDGEVKHESEIRKIPIQTNRVLEPEKTVKIAFKREGDSVTVNLGHGGVSSRETLEGLFDGYAWTSSPDWQTAGDLKIIASDGGRPPVGRSSSTAEQRKNRGNKLYLRFVTRGTSEAEITSELAPDQQTVTPAELAATEQVRQKLKHIIIPYVFMKDLTLTECMEFFRTRAQKFDPEPDVNRKGVNFVIDVKPGEPDLGERRVNSLNIGGVSLGDALKHVCTATGVAYKVDGNTVVICDAPKN